MRIGLGILFAVFLTAPRISSAQTPATNSAPPQPPRIYVDVNLLGYANPIGSAKTFENYAPLFGEVATFKASYPEPSQSGGFPAYVGGGYMLNRAVGVGLSYSQISRDSVADLSAEVPHPYFFNALATGMGSSGTVLSRRESAVHVSVVIAPVRSRRMEVHMMGGPSFFTLKGDMVREVEYEQTFNELAPVNAIAIRGASRAEIGGSAIGFHVGADFTYFVTRFAGVTGGVRYGSATVALETEPLSNLSQEFLVGSTTTFLGLRFRLGPQHHNE